jgi:AcrR family transcriptional regulator
MITDALGRIASRQGLSGVTFREVAAEAGVSVGLVQHYFASKDELLLAALRHLAERVAKRVGRAVTALGPDATERDRIRATLLEFLPLDDERRTAMILFRGFHDGGVNNQATTGAEAAKTPQAFDATMRRRLTLARDAGQLRPGVDVGHEAAILQLAVTGLAESVIAGLMAPARAVETVDYLLDRAFR